MHGYLPQLMLVTHREQLYLNNPPVTVHSSPILHCRAPLRPLLIVETKVLLSEATHERSASKLVLQLLGGEATYQLSITYWILCQ